MTKLAVVNNKLSKAARRSLSHIWFTSQAIDYWPVTNSVLWVQWRLWGLNPTGYHIVNLILHITNALLIWLVLRRMAIPGAFLAAVLFAVASRQCPERGLDRGTRKTRCPCSFR